MKNDDKKLENKPKGCNRSCCSCSCLLIVISFIIFVLFAIYAFYYLCWHIDNRVIEKLKTGELNSGNAYKYIMTTVKEHFFPKTINDETVNEENVNTNRIKEVIYNSDKSEDVDTNTSILDDNDSNELNNSNNEEESPSDSDFKEVDQLIKNNEIRKKLDVVLKDKLNIKTDFTEINKNNNPNPPEKSIPTTNNKKIGKFDYLLDLSENELIEQVGDDIEKNKAILKVVVDKDYEKALKGLFDKDGNLERELIENRNLLIYSAEKNSVKCRNFLINKGFDLNTEYQGKNLLHIAAQKGDLELAKKCISIGLQVNKKTNIGYSPFYFSVMSGDLNMIKYLVSKGANVEKNLKYLAKSREIYDYIDSFE